MATELFETNENVCLIAKQLKRSACEEAGGSANLDSCLFFDVGGDGFLGVSACKQGNPVDLLPETLDAVHHRGVRRFESVSFVTDVYFRSVPLEKVKRSDLGYQRGDLAKEFADNPFTDIVEALCVFSMSWSGESRVTVLEYKLDDNGLPLFVESHDSDSDTVSQIGGRVLQVLSSFITFCKLSPSDKPSV